MITPFFNSLHPGDLHPFTRRPLFLVVESDNSRAFGSMPRHFEQPLVVLMSPQEMPKGFYFSTSSSSSLLLDDLVTTAPAVASMSASSSGNKGSLYTLFLHSPLSAFCAVTNIVDIPIHLWDKCQTYIDRFMTEASRLMTRCRTLGNLSDKCSSITNFIMILFSDTSYLIFMGDDFLRLLLCRHLFATVVLKAHRLFRTRAKHHPDSFPPLPELDILENPTLQR